MAEMQDISLTALAQLRSRLLDLTRRNKLLNFREAKISIRIIDELPDQVFRILVTDLKGMTFLPLPEEEDVVIKTTPSPNFQTEKGTERNAITVKNLKEYLKIDIGPVGDNGENISPDDSKQSTIAPNDELPLPNEAVSARHEDEYLQTPYEATKLERRSKKLAQVAKTAIEETGSNFLYLAMGFLEWYENENSSEVTKAPLILIPVQIERAKQIDKETQCYKYILSYTEEGLETNLSLAEKLSRDFNLILPDLNEDTTPEEYFRGVSDLIARQKRWRVAREMVVDLFSFQKILIYKDLDPGKCIIVDPIFKTVV